MHLYLYPCVQFSIMFFMLPTQQFIYIKQSEEFNVLRSVFITILLDVIRAQTIPVCSI
jgi:hypothetical protein